MGDATWVTFGEGAAGGGAENPWSSKEEALGTGEGGEGLAAGGCPLKNSSKDALGGGGPMAPAGGDSNPKSANTSPTACGDGAGPEEDDAMPPNAANGSDPAPAASLREALGAAPKSSGIVRGTWACGAADLAAAVAGLVTAVFFMALKRKWGAGSGTEWERPACARKVRTCQPGRGRSSCSLAGRSSSRRWRSWLKMAPTLWQRAQRQRQPAAAGGCSAGRPAAETGTYGRNNR